MARCREQLVADRAGGQSELAGSRLRSVGPERGQTLLEGGCLGLVRAVRRVDDNDRGDQLGMFQREFRDDLPAHRMSDRHHRTELQPVDERREVPRIVRRPISVREYRRTPVTAQVDGDDAVAFEGQAAPRAAVATPAMDEQQRITRTGVTQPDRYPAGFDIRRHGWQHS